MPGHSVPLAALGGFILFFGFVAFNGGSQLTVSNDGDADAIATAVFATVLGGSAGGLVVLAINRVAPSGGKWSCLLTINGGLGGMVAQVGKVWTREGSTILTRTPLAYTYF